MNIWVAPVKTQVSLNRFKRARGTAQVPALGSCCLRRVEIYRRNTLDDGMKKKYLFFRGGSDLEATKRRQESTEAKNLGSFWVMVCSPGIKLSQGTTRPWTQYHFLSRSTGENQSWPCLREGWAMHQRGGSRYSQAQPNMWTTTMWTALAAACPPSETQWQGSGEGKHSVWRFQSENVRIDNRSEQSGDKQVCNTPDVSNLHAWVYIFI